GRWSQPRSGTESRRRIAMANPSANASVESSDWPRQIFARVQGCVQKFQPADARRRSLTRKKLRLVTLAATALATIHELILCLRRVRHKLVCAPFQSSLN